MILIFEIDKTVRNGRRWVWRPMLFKGLWRGRRTWRVGWGLFTLSYYPVPGLRSFFQWVEGHNTCWYPGPRREVPLC
jgi:hypothetical protein